MKASLAANRDAVAVAAFAAMGLSLLALAGCSGSGYGGGDGSTPASLTISVSPTSIVAGQSATITWNSNAPSCTASGAWTGNKFGSGTENVSPPAPGSYTYTLRCSGGGYGESNTESATLTVTATAATAAGFTQTILVARFPGTSAQRTDVQLMNPRGIAFAPGAPGRISGSEESTRYDGTGRQQSAFRVRLPGDATGIVVNSTSHFVIEANGKSGPAEFIYAGREGVIGGWSAAVDAAAAVTMYADAGDAAYTGLAFADSKSGAHLYATDFFNNRIDVFDGNFSRQTPSSARFSFNDPALPAGYAAFGIQTIGSGGRDTRIVVTYARPLQPDRRDAVAGAGLGLANVFDTDGRWLARLASPGGTLDAPWAIALAPADFGTLGPALLIANSGDGTIDAFDPATGRFVGTLSDADGRPIVARGVRGIAFGNDSHEQPHNTLFFTAGQDDADGIYGRIDSSGSPAL